ncbi:hypothetical protein Y900_023625 [Mycolicibacterium aromaticivorans JS19b1 = JCM 16368]|uniref:DUF732 domain-containing protein n=1 Tax=Mycolicibacterium aromaticivorans JS19b1 = JCM 16368 TaxID=1440774 RepID=A0A064CSR6_9MYCO|nr:hypothetical protein Y900_023625 [Mycolicibacterium aromaticivorans JS19b1 = JCM 16368]
MKIALPAAALGLAVGVSVCTAGIAMAVPINSGSAADVVKALQDQGYTVQFNGPSTTMPLSRCTVNGVHGLVVMMMADGSLTMRMDPGNPGVAYVDLSCPIGN